MPETKTTASLALEMVLTVLHPIVLAIRPYDKLHECKDEHGNKFLFHVLGFEWNKEQTEAEVFAFLCDKEGKELTENGGSYILQFNHKEGKVTVKEVLP